MARRCRSAVGLKHLLATENGDGFCESNNGDRDSDGYRDRTTTPTRSLPQTTHQQEHRRPTHHRVPLVSLMVQQAIDPGRASLETPFRTSVLWELRSQSMNVALNTS